MQKSLRTTMLVKALAGPFIGPKGGKWADAAHTIPWHEVGHSWQSVDGRRTITGVVTLPDGSLRHKVLTEGNPLSALIAPHEIVREQKFDEKNLERRTAGAAKAAEAARVAEAAKAQRADLFGFTTGMTPLATTRAVTTLNKERLINGQFVRLRTFIEDEVGKGATVETTPSGRRFSTSRGTYFLEKDLSKLALDYAAHLAKKEERQSVLTKSANAAVAGGPRFIMTRWPGQVPDRDAIEALRIAQQEPPKWTVARMMAHDGAYLTPGSVVDGIGLDEAKRQEWVGHLKKAAASTNELTFRQDIMGKMLHDRMDPASRQALFQRAMGFYRDMRKSLVEVVSPDDLRKSQGEGSRGGHVVGHTAGGSPIYDTPHMDMVRHHLAASDAARAVGDHATANAHVTAARAHKAARYLPRDANYSRPDAERAAHTAWDLSHKAAASGGSKNLPHPDRLEKAIVRRVRRAPPSGLPLAKLDDLVRRYGRRAIADTLEKACRDRDGLHYRNGVLKVR